MSTLLTASSSPTADDKFVDDSFQAIDLPNGALPSPPPSAVWLKMDLIVLPVISMMYFLSSLDRTNIGNARIAGLQKQLHMSNEEYSFSLTLALIPFTLIEIPSNHLMMRVGPRLLLPAMTTLWGVACALEGTVSTYSGLLACRFFLGLFEGGLTPGMFFYLASFYPRHMLQLRIAVIFSTYALASAFSGLLAAAILNMDGIGGRPGWAWMFILEGLFSVVFGISSFFLLPNSPGTAKTLNEKEREIVTHTLLLDGISEMGNASENHSWAEFRQTFLQPHVVVISIMSFFSGTTLLSLAYYLPSIVASLGFTGTKAQLMSVPPFAASSVVCLIVAFSADRYGHRGVTVMVSSLVSLAGYAMFLASSNNHVRYGSLFLSVTGIYCLPAAVGAWISNNTAPIFRRGTALAFFTVMVNSGGILSTWLFGALSAPPRYTSATVTLLIFQVAVFVMASATRVYLAMENKRKARLRAESREKGPETVVMGHMSTSAKAVVIPNDSIWFEYVL